MGPISTIFHVASLLGLVGLIFVVLRLQRSLKLLRHWSLPPSVRGVSVGEPIRVLRVFASAMGAEFDAEVPANALSPRRVDLSNLFEVHRAAGIRRITVSKGEPPLVSFHLHTEAATIEGKLHQIAHDFGCALRSPSAYESE